MSDGRILWELKEKAKWSHDTEECKTAVSELSRYGEKALPSLEEVLNVSAYEEVKATCVEAIKAVKEKETPTTTTTKSQKKEESGAESEKLADLPP